MPQGPVDFLTFLPYFDLGFANPAMCVVRTFKF